MGGGKTAEQCFNRWHAEYSERAALEQRQQQQQHWEQQQQQQQQQAQGYPYPPGGERANESCPINVLLVNNCARVARVSEWQSMECYPFPKTMYRGRQQTRWIADHFLFH